MRYGREGFLFIGGAGLWRKKRKGETINIEIKKYRVKWGDTETEIGSESKYGMVGREFHSLVGLWVKGMRR